VSLQQSVVVLDAQVLSRPQSAWWSSLAVLKLTSSIRSEDGPQLLQRIRMCSLKLAGKSRRSGPICLYTTRASKMEVCAPSRGDPLPGLALSALPLSPFSFGFVETDRKGRAPALATSGNTCNLDSRFKDHYCDLVGCLIAVGPVEPVGNFARARCSLFAITFGQKLCRIWLDDRASSLEGAVASLSKTRSKFSALQSRAQPQVLAFENLTFEWHDTKSGLVHFHANRLHLRISRTPSDAGLKEAISKFDITAAEIAQTVKTLTEHGYLKPTGMH